MDKGSGNRCSQTGTGCAETKELRGQHLRATGSDSMVNSKSEITYKEEGECGEICGQRRHILICVFKITQAAPRGWAEWEGPGGEPVSRLFGEER